MAVPPQVRALRGAALTFRADPFAVGDEAAMHYEPDALLVLESGRIQAFGDHGRLRPGLPASVAVEHYRDALILPGFIDTHVHYPQTQIIGAYGGQLMQWLERHTFPAEQQFADPAHARAVADLFLAETLRAGTTTAAVYGTVHPQSADAFFEAALAGGRRMIAGKAMMDRHAPEGLTDTVRSGYDDSERLIRQWHGRGRLAYAVTPRYAGSCTPAQLEAAGALWRAYPGTFMQTHLSENRAEIAWIAQLFPERKDYLDVYDHYGLTGPRALFGHGIHLREREWRCLHRSGSALCHCPTSNAFLGSGLFRFDKAKPAARPVRVGLASDVGAGTTLSMLKTMGAAYQIAQLGGRTLSGPQALYLATRGAAEALYLDDTIGSLAPGMEADLVVLDMKSTPLIDFRMRHCASLDDALFMQMTMADERATLAVYVAGELAYVRGEA